MAEEIGKLYRDVIRYAAPTAILELMRNQMGVAEERYESEFFRSFYRDAHEEDVQAGREQGLQAGREQGLQAGREEGLQAMRRTLQSVLDARGFTLEPRHATQIDDCTDTATLQRWIQKAATSDSVRDVLS